MGVNMLMFLLHMSFMLHYIKRNMKGYGSFPVNNQRKFAGSRDTVEELFEYWLIIYVVISVNETQRERESPCMREYWYTWLNANFSRKRPKCTVIACRDEESEVARWYECMSEWVREPCKLSRRCRILKTEEALSNACLAIKRRVLAGKDIVRKKENQGKHTHTHAHT